MIAKLIFNPETVNILPTSPDGSGILLLGYEAEEWPSKRYSGQREKAPKEPTLLKIKKTLVSQHLLLFRILQYRRGKRHSQNLLALRLRKLFSEPLQKCRPEPPGSGHGHRW